MKIDTNKDYKLYKNKNSNYSLKFRSSFLGIKYWVWLKEWHNHKGGDLNDFDNNIPRLIIKNGWVLLHKW
jgi:hypothetical protein